MAGMREPIGVAGVLILLIALLLSAMPIAAIQSDHDGTRVSSHQAAPNQTRSEEYYMLYAWASTDPKKALPGTNVTLDGSGSFGTYEIVNYTWNFTVGKNEIILYGATVTYCFTEPDDYSVLLWVRDSQGNTAGMGVLVIITNDLQNQPPVAVITVYGPCWVNESLNIYGGSSSDDCSISNWVWTINGRGTTVNLTGSEMSVLYYSFTRTGEYNITLTVTDLYGLNGSDTVRIRVIDVPELPVAEAGPNQTAYVGQEVVFDGRNSRGGAILDNWTWYIIDGAPMTLYGSVVRHSFQTPGNHLVILKVWDVYWREDSDEMAVLVTGQAYAPPVADAGDDETIRVGTEYRFDGSQSTGDVPELGYMWNFEYNATHEIMYGVRPVFTFAIPGDYNVTLTLTDSLGFSDSDSVTVIVTERDPSTPDYAVLLIFEGGCAAAVIALVLYWRRLNAT